MAAVVHPRDEEVLPVGRGSDCPVGLAAAMVKIEPTTALLRAS
jgi:hypothetical protein